jgi:hypothetical protein
MTHGLNDMKTEVTGSANYERLRYNYQQHLATLHKSDELRTAKVVKNSHFQATIWVETT